MLSPNHSVPIKTKSRQRMGLVACAAITFAPFHAATQYLILFHTAVGALTLLPLAWYCARQWVD